MRKGWGSEIAILTPVVILGLYLRLYDITDQSFWYDEAYTGILATSSWPELSKQLLYDVHPPIHIFLVKVIGDIFGHSELVLRSISAFFGVLTIPLAYLAGSHLAFTKHKKLTGYIFAVMIAVNPFLVAYSQEARSYTLVAFLYLSLIYIFHKARQQSPLNPSIKWMLFGAVSVMLFMTHYISVLGIISLVLFDIAQKSKSVNLTRHIFQKLKTYGAAFTIPALTVLPYLYWILREQLSNAPIQWWIPFVGPEKVYDSLYGFLFGVNAKTLGVPPYSDFIINISTASIGFIIYTLITIQSSRFIYAKAGVKHQNLLLLLTAGVLPIILVLLFQNMDERLYVERYLIAFSIGIIGVVAGLIASSKRYITTSILLVYMLISAIIIAKPHQSNSSIKDISDIYKSIKPNNALVIFDNPIDFVVAKYYFRDDPVNQQIRLQAIRQGSDAYSDWELINRSDLLTNYSQLKNKHRIFVYSKNKKADIWYRDKMEVTDYTIYSTVYLPRYHAMQ